MDADGLSKKRKVLQEQVAHLQKTYKLGLLTKHEFALAQKRLQKQFTDVEQQLKTKETKRKAVKEILSGHRSQKQQILRKPVVIPPKKIVVPQRQAPHAAVLAGESIEDIHAMKIKELRKKTWAYQNSQEQEKKREVAKILSTLEESPVHADGTTGPVEGASLVSPPDRSLLPPLNVKEMPHSDSKESKEHKGVGSRPALDHLYDQVSSDSESIRWKIALTVLGIFLVVLLYLKFSSSLGMGDSLLVEVYHDYTCVPCAHVYEEVSSLQSVYGKRLGILYKHLPLTEQGLLAAQAAECAGDQSKFLPYHERLYEHTLEEGSVFTLPLLTSYAGALGLDSELFEKCLKSEIKKPLIERERRKALDAGIDAVPTVVLGGQKKLVGVFSKDVYTREINLLLDREANS